MNNKHDIVLYQIDDTNVCVSVYFEDETFWLTTKAMAELFGVKTQAITKHLGNIYEEEELTREATCSKKEQVQIEGDREVKRNLDFYNLDAIIAVGYRVNSKKATRFRQWATKTLKEYITKGFVLNDDMLKNGKPFGKDYFDELLERIREIRASERRAYQKITDVFEQCSYDYDKNSEITRAFYAFVQNTLSKELYSSIQINGDGFDQEWAKKSVKLLCYQKRKVFYGNNLFARGACAAGAERLITHRLRDYRYMSRSLVLTSVGMEMRVMGAPTYYPLIEAGRNWYESSADIELILDDTDELVFVVEHMRESERRHIVMKLPGLPQRPNRTTRLSVSLRYVAAEECCITVKDLGFGEMFPASGKEWKETTRWQEGIA